MLTIGPSLYPALEAADELSAPGIEAEGIDARTLVPFDYATLVESVIVLGAPNWIAPGVDMEDSYAPQPHDICDAVLGDFFAGKRVNRRGLRDWDIIDMAKRGI